MATAVDNSSGVALPDPDQIEQQQQDDNEANLASASPFRRNFATGTLLGRSLFGNPRLEKAQNVQQAVSNSIQDSDASADPDETGIDAQIRRLKATYAAVADKSPQAALQISNKLSLLQEAKTQQSKLNAQTDAETALAQQRADADKLNLYEKGTRVIGNAETGKQYGTVRVFDENGNMVPGWQQQVAKLKADSGDPNAQDVQQDQWFNNKFQLAMLQGQIKERLAAQKAAAGNGLTADGLKYLVAQHALFGDGALSRRNQQERDAVVNTEADAGISAVDMAQARNEMKAAAANAGAQGRREGNVAFLSSSIPGLGQNVVDSLDGVSRSDFTPLNAAVRLGKTKIYSSAGEQVYAAALQSFVSEYARVINGGTGQSTDAARDEAWNVLGRDGSPDAIKAAIKFLSNKELVVMQQAGPLALDALRNPDNYKSTLKIQQKLGIPLLQGGEQVGASLGQDPDQPAPAQATPPAAKPPAAADKFVAGKSYTDAKGNRAKYLGNGQWQPL